ncbi:MAG TPA: ATP-dependent zinc metalloprotease FtsH [Acidimicrobiales bacterium]|nr:ATP-dependent zinc metalloprotease FtsH [Acidimicrobiales bacterium]
MADVARAEAKKEQPEGRRRDAAKRLLQRTSWARSPAPLLSISLIVLAVVYAVALALLSPPSSGQPLSLDLLTRYATCGGSPRPASDPSLAAYCQTADQKVGRANFLDEDSRIVGTLVPLAGGPERKFSTSYPKSDAATNDLLKALFTSGARVTVEPQTGKRAVRFVAQFLLPLVLLANLFALLFYLVQGRGGGASEFTAFGRAGDKRQRTDDARVTFSDVAAADEAITELAEVRDYLADPSAFAEMGAQPPKGVLLVGPPGCGKTLLARAVAGEAQASFLSMSGSEFVEALVGVGAARVRDLFSQARANAPAIVFIDEIDAVGRQRGAGLGHGHDEREQTLNELLVQMDGFSPSLGIVALAATNRPDILDPALLRAGRFDRHVTLERPDVAGRLEVLRVHAEGRRLANAEADLEEVARHSTGFTGADLANVINESALLAVRERVTSIQRHHLDEAVERVMAGPKRRGQLISDQEKFTIANHEAGHAVVAAALGKAGAIQKVSTIARGRGIGHLAVLAEDRTILRRGDMEAQVAISMAGFAAEEILFGEPSTGSEQDLERATTVARDMAGRYGMSSQLGPVRLLREQREVFLGRDYLDARDISQPMLEDFDTEVRRIVDQQKEAARAILDWNRPVLDALASALISHETVQGPELQHRLAAVRSPRSTTKPRKAAKKAAGTSVAASNSRGSADPGSRSTARQARAQSVNKDK